MLHSPTQNQKDLLYFQVTITLYLRTEEIAATRGVESVTVQLCSHLGDAFNKSA